MTGVQTCALPISLQLPKKTRNDSIALTVSEFPLLTRVSNKFVMRVRSRGVHDDEINKIYGRGTILGSKNSKMKIEKLSLGFDVIHKKIRLIEDYPKRMTFC